ncbi:MAG: LysM peptidoglycan-binding domain-containing protein [Endomicrobiales bacterium]|nr:LysM peptidoglycan-binding domain-containing protein [Endomicrobiales bacterium]
MKITRLHILLITIIIATLVIYVFQFIQQKRIQEESAFQKVIESRVPEIEVKKEEVQKQKKPVPKKDLAVQAVAVAGEYWKITKEEGRNYKIGQTTLRKAKEYLKTEDYENAWKLARQSIDEFKAAPVLRSKYYKVCRGDCLWNIAKLPQHYGRGSMWVKIWRANESKIPDFDIIYTGQMLYIPKEN